jgi:uncharacterized protein
VIDAVPRVFIDTNVWISAFLNGAGAPARILAAFLSGLFVPVVSRALLDEIEDVLQRPRVHRRCRFTDEEIALILSELRDRAIEAFPRGDLHVCRDPDDDIMLETALLGGAQFAVSRDDDIKRDLDLMEHLRVRGVEVLSVAQLVALLGL